MIQLNELMVGNFFTNRHETLRVANIIADTNNQYITIHGYPDQKILVQDPDVLGIPLSEAWLLKFGFEHNEPTFKVKINGLRLILFQINASNDYNDNENEFTVTVYQHNEGIEIARVKFVHQLQNLHFTLTGEELKIK